MQEKYIDPAKYMADIAGKSLSHAFDMAEKELYQRVKQREEERKQEERLIKMKQDILDEVKAYVDSYIELQIEDKASPALKELDKKIHKIFGD